MDKKIHFKVDKENTTLQEVLEKIQEIQDENPDLEVFFDGDEFAVCSRPKKSEN